MERSRRLRIKLNSYAIRDALSDAMKPRVLIFEPLLAHSAWMKLTAQLAGVRDYRIESDPFLALDAYLSGRFDLVLAAWPFKMEGCEWITAAKSMLREADPPVIAMLTNAGKSERRAALKHKADGTIAKPFARCDLMAIMHQHFEKAVYSDNVIDFARFRKLRGNPSIATEKSSA